MSKRFRESPTGEWRYDKFARGDRFVIHQNGITFQSAAYYRTPTVDAEIPMTMAVEVERHLASPEKSKFVAVGVNWFRLPSVI